MKIVFYFPREAANRRIDWQFFWIFVGRHVIFCKDTHIIMEPCCTPESGRKLLTFAQQSSLWGIIDRCVPGALRKNNGDRCRFPAGRPRQTCQQETKVHHLFPQLMKEWNMSYIYIQCNKTSPIRSQMVVYIASSFKGGVIYGLTTLHPKRNLAECTGSTPFFQVPWCSTRNFGVSEMGMGQKPWMISSSLRIGALIQRDTPYMGGIFGL